MRPRSNARNCTDCGTELPKGSRSKGLCRVCYLRQRAESPNMATCHPEERMFGKGFCKKCYYKANPMSPETQRACYLRKAYGLLPSDLVKKIEEQENKCAICRKEFVKEADTNIDHCHKTGQVRGILCRWCNIGLGNFKDNVGFLYEAINYLRAYPTA